MSSSKKQRAEPGADRDEWVAECVRNFRRNPHGVEGPLVIQCVVLLVAAVDTNELALDPLELDHWTGAALGSLAQLATQQGSARKRAREDARWALSQIGLTPDSARETLADEEKRHELLSRLWAERLTRLLLDGQMLEGLERGAREASSQGR